MKKFDHELIICIVNEGFSELVMEAAKDVGAKGGTVVRARGTANKESEELFKITIEPKKEMVMILVPTSIKESVLKMLYEKVGLQTPGQGIAFSMPVDNVIGLTEENQDNKK